jgi:hypothetical protein
MICAAAVLKIARPRYEVDDETVIELIITILIALL